MDELLLLTHRIPYPPNKGDKIRSWNLLRHLAQCYRVHLGTFVDDPEDWAHVPRLREICDEVCCVGIKPRMQRLAALRGLLTGEPLTLPYYRDGRLRRWVDDLLMRRPVARAVAFSGATAQYLQGAGGPPWIADLVDVDSDKWRQYAERRRGLMRWLYAREARHLAQYEAAIAEHAQTVLLVSEQETELFRNQVARASNVVALPNGVDTDYFSPERSYADPYPSGIRPIVFTGAMDYWPNVDAVTWFASELLPTLRERVPEAMFYIVGSRPDASVRGLADRPGVAVTGTVPDVRPYLAHAGACIAPLRTARGIQNKVLEAMAMARPVVVTPQALEGLDARPDQEVLVGRNPEGLIEAVARALESPPADLGRAARERVDHHYSWSGVLARLEVLLGGEPSQRTDPAASAVGR